MKTGKSGTGKWEHEPGGTADVEEGTPLRLLAAGHSQERILAAYPELEAAAIAACIQYASMLADDRGLVLEPT